MFVVQQKRTHPDKKQLPRNKKWKKKLVESKRERPSTCDKKTSLSTMEETVVSLSFLSPRYLNKQKISSLTVTFCLFIRSLLPLKITFLSAQVTRTGNCQ